MSKDEQQKVFEETGELKAGPQSDRHGFAFQPPIRRHASNRMKHNLIQ